MTVELIKIVVNGGVNEDDTVATIMEVKMDVIV